jgi:hypothetical protein
MFRGHDLEQAAAVALDQLTLTVAHEVGGKLAVRAVRASQEQVADAAEREPRGLRYQLLRAQLVHQLFLALEQELGLLPVDEASPRVDVGPWHLHRRHHL